MSTDEKQCLRLGQEILKMTRDLESAARTDGPAGAAYSRRRFIFRQGAEYTVFIVRTDEVAAAMEKGVAAAFNVATSSPVSEPHQ